MKYRISQTIPDDYSLIVEEFRQQMGLTQQALAERLGASFATVNRWENGQTKPTRLYWDQLRDFATSVAGLPAHYDAQRQSLPRPCSTSLLIRSSSRTWWKASGSRLAIKLTRLRRGVFGH
jgi:transcriptional regulator with XRE-family HTH domain